MFVLQQMYFLMVIFNQKGYREDPSAALRVNLMIYFALAKYYLIKKPPTGIPMAA